MTKCKHDEGFYINSRVSMSQHFDENGVLDMSVFDKIKGGSIAYCSLCNVKIGKTSQFVKNNDHLLL